MMADHRKALAAFACAGLLLTAGCGGSDPDPRPTPSITSTPTQTPTNPTWESKFNHEQIAAYEAALARFTEYETRAEPIWATGKATAAAEAVFKEYWVAWPVKLNTLRAYEANGLAISGIAKVLSSEPARIDVKSAAARVVIKQCVDPSTISVTRNGEPQKPSGHEPYIRTLTLDRGRSGPFKVSSVQDITNSQKVKPCGS